jgi:hypothetical protein
VSGNLPDNRNHRHSRERAGVSGENPPRAWVRMRKYPLRLGVVMAGLDPAISVLATGASGAGNRVDARVKPAHDDL